MTIKKLTKLFDKYANQYTVTVYRNRHCVFIVYFDKNSGSFLQAFGFHRDSIELCFMEPIAKFIINDMSKMAKKNLKHLHS